MWIDLTPELTEEGQEKLQVGQVLFFNFEGSETQLKITRKRNGKVWAKQVYMYRPEEVTVEVAVSEANEVAVVGKK